MKKVRIAVVGAGLIGYRHIEEIRKNPECELSSLVAPKPPARIAGLGAKAGLSARTLGRRFFSAANVPAHFRRCRETRLHSRSGAGGMNAPATGGKVMDRSGRASHRLHGYILKTPSQGNGMNNIVMAREHFCPIGSSEIFDVPTLAWYSCTQRSVRHGHSRRPRLLEFSPASPSSA